MKRRYWATIIGTCRVKNAEAADRGDFEMMGYLRQVEMQCFYQMRREKENGKK